MPAVSGAGVVTVTTSRSVPGAGLLGGVQAGVPWSDAGGEQHPVDILLAIGIGSRLAYRVAGRPVGAVANGLCDQAGDLVARCRALPLDPAGVPVDHDHVGRPGYR